MTAAWYGPHRDTAASRHVFTPEPDLPYRDTALPTLCMAGMAGIWKDVYHIVRHDLNKFLSRYGKPGPAVMTFHKTAVLRYGPYHTAVVTV